MKQATAAGDHVEQLEQVRSVCLYVATTIADLRDEWVIIGGLVPSLLIDQRRHAAADRQVGTLDLDLGLQLGILELREAGDQALRRIDPPQVERRPGEGPSRATNAASERRARATDSPAGPRTGSWSARATSDPRPARYHHERQHARAGARRRAWA